MRSPLMARSRLQRFGTLLRALAALALAGSSGCGTGHHRSTLPAPLAPSAWPADAVWLEPLRTSGSAIAFPEELHGIENAIGQALVRAGYVVIPPAESRAAIARMQAGQLPDREGQCTPLPPADGFLAHRYGAHRVTSSLACDAAPRPGETAGALAPSCVLTIGVHAGEGPPTHEAVLRFPLDTTREAIIARLNTSALPLPLAPVPAGGGDVFGMGGLGVRLNVSVSRLELAGAWDPGSTRDLGRQLEHALTPHRDALLACEVDEPMFDHWANDFVVEVDARGAITRCEPELPDHRPAPGFACTCKVLASRLDFGAEALDRRASGARRLRFGLSVLSHEAEQALSAHRARAGNARTVLDVLTTDDPSVQYGDVVLGPELNACVEAHGAAIPQTELVADLEVGPDGRVVHAEARPVEGDTLDSSLAACALTALRATRFTCPFEGRAHVRGAVRLAWSAYGAGQVEAALVTRATESGLELPTGNWHLEAPLPDAPLYTVRADGVVSGEDGAPLAGPIASEDVRLIADARVTLDALASWLASVDAPSLRRIFVATRSGEEVLWRQLHVTRAPRAVEFTVAATPPTRAAIDAVPSRVVGLGAPATTTLATLMATVDAIRDAERRPLWVLSPR